MSPNGGAATFQAFRRSRHLCPFIPGHFTALSSTMVSKQNTSFSLQVQPASSDLVDGLPGILSTPSSPSRLSRFSTLSMFSTARSPTIYSGDRSVCVLTTGTNVCLRFGCLSPGFGCSLTVLCPIAVHLLRIHISLFPILYQELTASISPRLRLISLIVQVRWH